MRGDPIEDEAGGFALRCAPGRGAGRHQIGLRTQDDAVVDHFKSIGCKRSAGRGLSTIISAAPAAGAPSVAPVEFDDPVIDYAVLGEEAAGQVGVFGRKPHFAFVLEPKCGGDIVEIGHVAHVDPGLRYGNNNIGEAEAEASRHADPLEQPVNVMHPPNPAKAPWYFLGLQEMVSYSAFWGGVGIPTIEVLIMLLVPYIDRKIAGVGKWFAKERLLANSLFVTFAVVNVILMIIGTFFRGANWEFVSPW